MLERRTVFDGGGITISDVACRHRPGRGEPSEPSATHAIVFVRRGCFARSADGVPALLDPSVAYCMNPGEEQRYDHPHDGGDDCTSLALDPGTAASLWGDDHPLPKGPFPTLPGIDLAQRSLLAAARRGADRHWLYERAIIVAANALEQSVPDPRVPSGRPHARRARRALVDDCREALVADPDMTLPELARLLAVSPHYLSRTFHQVTGHTVARQRILLRARAALERLAGGERNLARVAADVGFADQSHLCRTLKALTSQTPRALRTLLA